MPGHDVQRLTLFAKGNVDVRDTLVAQRLGSAVAWNGINEILRERSVPCSIRVRHETFTRSDSLARATGEVPRELAERSLALGPYPAASQFSAALYAGGADAYVLSIQADVFMNMLRHRRDGYLLFAHGWTQSWPQDDQAWARECFDPLGQIDVDTSMDNLSRVVARIRENSDAPVLLYNVCSVMPGDTVHCYAGVGETYSTRARRFNLALAELSARTGISIVDVDRVLARAGADLMTIDPIHFTVAGCRAVAEEVVRILADLSLLPAEACL